MYILFFAQPYPLQRPDLTPDHRCSASSSGRFCPHARFLAGMSGEIFTHPESPGYGTDRTIFRVTTSTYPAALVRRTRLYGSRRLPLPSLSKWSCTRCSPGTRKVSLYMNRYSHNTPCQCRFPTAGELKSAERVFLAIDGKSVRLGPAVAGECRPHSTF